MQPAGSEFWLIGVQDDADDAADAHIFNIPQKVMVLEAGVIVEGTDDDGGVIKFDRRILAGSDTGRGDGDVGAVTLPASNVQGKVYYDHVYKGSDLDAGDQVVTQVTTAYTGAQLYTPYLRLRAYTEIPANQSDKVETA